MFNTMIPAALSFKANNKMVDGILCGLLISATSVSVRAMVMYLRKEIQNLTQEEAGAVVTASVNRLMDADLIVEKERDGKLSYTYVIPSR